MLLTGPLAATYIAKSTTPEMNDPRIGDNICIYELESEPCWIDSGKNEPNLSNLKIKSAREVHIIEASKSDSSAVLLIHRKGDILQLCKHDSILLVLTHTTAGQQRHFLSDFPYISFTFLQSSFPVESYGITKGIGKFFSHGTCKNTYDFGLKTISEIGDTISDIECWTSEIYETLIYLDNDTTIHKGISKKWFAPGFRYPILTHYKDFLFDAAGISLDYVSSWEYISLENQSIMIENDFINEAIRLAHTEKSVTLQPDAHFASAIENFHFEWDEISKTISLNNTSTEFHIDLLVICDITGRLYKYQKCLTFDSQIISLADYPPGNYCIVCFGEEETLTFKITIP